jgi:Na+/H+ antiporter NhaD/arsenite permease-like protein
MDVRLAVLLATYACIAAPRIPGTRINRPAAALLGAVAMVTIGGLPMREALGAIDLDVLVFLLGVFVLTGFLELGGFFEWAAVKIVARAHSARALLAAVVVLSGALSALFVNDTVCLVLTPLVLAVVRPLRLRPLPFLLAVALASNVGSAMTPAGNPQNMLIGVSSGIGFGRFVAALALPACGGLVIVYAVLTALYRRELAQPLPHEPERPPVQLDGPLVVKSLVLFVLALAG